MSQFIARLAAVALCAAAGFAAARLWPMAEKTSTDANPPAVSTNARAPWLSLKGGPRLAACLDHCASVSAAAWPADFARHQNDELLRPALLEGWIDADPAGFWKWIVSQKDESLLTEAGPRLFRTWAGRDAAAAFAATALISSPHLRDPLRALVIETELHRDIAAGFALAAQCGPLFSGNGGMAWVRKDPVAAVRGLTALPGGEESFRFRYLTAATRILAKENPLAFLEWLETKPRLVHRELWDFHFTEAPVADATRAIAAAAALPASTSRDRALKGAITAAAGTLTAEELVQTAGQHLKGWERLAAIGNAAEDTAKTDPVKAAQLLAALPACRYLRYAAGNVAAGYAKADWNAARAWVDALPDSPTRRVAWREFSHNIPSAQAQEFAAATAAMPQQELTDDLLRNVHHALGAQSPAAAKQWLASLPEDRAAWAVAVK